MLRTRAELWKDGVSDHKKSKDTKYTHIAQRHGAGAEKYSREVHWTFWDGGSSRKVEIECMLSPVKSNQRPTPRRSPSSFTTTRLIDP